MPKLIDLDKLLEYPIRINHYDKENGNEDFVLGVESVLEYAENLPAVDAVPVVHCKDCKWRGSENCAMFYRCECGEQHTWETDNDYCSYGEK